MLRKKMFLLEVCKYSTIFTLFTLHSCLCDTDTPRVYVDNDEFKGFVLGKKFQDSNNEYLGFRGIPYAKPPVGDLRFKDPQKLDKFEGTLDATHDGFECCSVTARNASEDCLNLNVYTKQLKPTELLPVVVLIHPGGLYLGSGASFYMNPAHMMTKDLVLVTFNHRLGTLGFLSLGTPEIPGNAGFKDQVFALRWVQKNIADFGGNPKDVTLMGYSAGALSVQFHMMSPMSKSLFHKAILMSGSLSPQAYLPQEQKYLAVKQAKSLNCSKFQDIEEEIPYGVANKFPSYENIKDEDILECLNQFNGTKISNDLRKMFDFAKDNPLVLWLPVIEKDFKQERFLTEHLQVSRKNLLIGYTNGELCLSSREILEQDSLREKFSKEFKTLAPRTFLYERNPKRDVISDEIRQKYFNGSKEFSKDDYDALCDLFSDALFRFSAHKFAEFLTQNGGLVYFYEFKFVEDSLNKDDEFQNKQEELDLLQQIYLYILNKSSARCDHMIDFQYLFNWPGRKHDSEEHIKIVDLYTDFIYDFVKNGKLSHEKAKPYPHSYALIDKTVEYVAGRNFENYEFWQKLFPDYFNYKLH